MRLTTFLALIHTTILIPLVVEAFVVSRAAGEKSSKILVLWSQPSSEGDEEEKRDAARFDLDVERQRIQALFSTQDAKDDDSSAAFQAPKQQSFDLAKFLQSSDDEYELPPLPPLTTMERDRRLAEIQLLRQLTAVEEGAATDAEAMGLLWNLWYSQFGVEAMKELQRTDQCMGDRSKWKECESILLKLVKDYGVYFCEPLNRLATLYFLQGRLNESYRLCRLILDKLKPWHVGALSGIVQVCIGLGKQEEAREWAEQRLPSIGNPQHQIQGLDIPRRSAWAEDMIAKAEASLEAAEQTTRDQLGSPDEHSTAAAEAKRTRNHIQREDMDGADGDAWQ